MLSVKQVFINPLCVCPHVCEPTHPFQMIWWWKNCCPRQPSRPTGSGQRVHVFVCLTRVIKARLWFTLWSWHAVQTTSFMPVAHSLPSFSTLHTLSEPPPQTPKSKSRAFFFFFVTHRISCFFFLFSFTVPLVKAVLKAGWDAPLLF